MLSGYGTPPETRAAPERGSPEQRHEPEDVEDREPPNMSARNIGTGWHLDTFGSDVAVSSEPDLVGSETPRDGFRFVLWSDVLPEPLGFRSWSETVTTAAGYWNRPRHPKRSRAVCVRMSQRSLRCRDRADHARIRGRPHVSELAGRRTRTPRRWHSVGSRTRILDHGAAIRMSVELVLLTVSFRVMLSDEK